MQIIFVSILVFLDMAFKEHGHSRKRTGRQMFQSLFFWIWPSKPAQAAPGIGVIKSFNPCFSGYGLQSLSCWTSPACIFVSILVFLDMAFKVSMLYLAPAWIVCFNPCFSGYGLQSFFIFIWSPMLIMFQSLFFWIWPSKIPLKIMAWAFVFVSILVFLDMAFKDGVFAIANYTMRVSILVFLDMAFKEIILQRVHVTLLVSILVFLDMAFKGGWIICNI